MRLFLKVPSSQEVITLEEVKIYLRISSDQEDDFLRKLILSSQTYVENMTGRALLKQEWEMHLTPPYPPSFPLVRNEREELIITLPRPPLLKLESVQTEGRDIPYKLQEDKVKLLPHFWGKAFSLTFWAGYGETASFLPSDLKMAVLMAARHFYEGQNVNLPLLNPYKVLHLL